MTAIFDTLLDDRNAHLSDGVREVLGRAPRNFGDFGDFVREEAEAGTWKALERRPGQGGGGDLEA
ncbi:hypothetical protein [Streptomyces luteogriseus]|uniref:hypothetical protein n=1 Tax=Streptomyces luteogriseus TaxID=68233 RepID=UPI002E37AA82|nr:hypothetical protein [Streptomyces luteogriseus]WTJ27120.1 hypothetical protein OID52_08700 [Streptomyces luteogriseus]